MEIRQEKKSERAVVSAIVREAFAAEGRDGDAEEALLSALRKSRSFLPKLSLTAAEDGKPVGYLLFTKADIGGETELALAVLAVLPEYRGRGIGAALVREGHRIAGTLGYGYAVALGEPRYFARLGYLPASLYGIDPPFSAPEEEFTAFRIDPSAEELNGTVLYDAAFRQIF
ncbi:MAG: N-acetyltransferase [Bacteroides sp.]|nr:N-acetyltransferase [Eubacterium sp.]MCM1418928.1 N-acetyltransferase [Roseburia sp.]MCM1462128.1 N-acetyltransferase [Bacteroides sp.]